VATVLCFRCRMPLGARSMRWHGCTLHRWLRRARALRDEWWERASPRTPEVALGRRAWLAATSGRRA